MRFFISLIVILFVTISNSYASKSKDLKKLIRCMMMDYYQERNELKQKKF